MMRFLAGKMPRVMACAGSYLAERQYPGQPSGATAKEGTVAHAEAAGCLGTGGMASNTHIQLYVNTCNRYRIVGEHTFIEREMAQEICAGTARLIGVPDFFCFSSDYTLTVIDFKYGRGVVEVEENWQLLTYAVLIWLLTRYTIPRVTLVIVQPRAKHQAGPVREWTFDGALLRNYTNMIENQIGAAMQQGAEFVSGEHCRYCKHIVNCPENLKKVAETIDLAGAPSQNLTGEQLAKELERVKTGARLINHRWTALEAYAVEHIRTGNRIPGWNVKQEYGALQWDIDPIEIIGKSVLKPAAPITPTQAISRKLLTKNQVEYMASRKLGAHKLTKEEITDAQKVIRENG